jgi:uncharacterized protein YndB with AHSA1/START domain
MMKVLTPVRKTIEVSCTPERAFDVFTKEIGTWWPLNTHTMLDGDATGCVFGTAPGEKIYETAPDGTKCVWGRVTTWEPPRHVTFEWKPNTNDKPPTEVDVTFEPSEGGTMVTLIHSGWERLGDGADEARASYVTGWDPVLGQYAKTATG